MTNLPHDPSQVRVADLSARRDNRFDLSLDSDDLIEIARVLGIVGVKKIFFKGTILSEGKRDWRLKADLGATVVQSCVISLAPVTTRIDTRIERRFVADFSDDVQDEEVEMPDDDNVEGIPDIIDLKQVMTESLALGLPDYPRAPDAELGESAFTAPGQEPLRDKDLNPFAGLAGLKKKLENEDPES